MRKTAQQTFIHRRTIFLLIALNFGLVGRGESQTIDCVWNNPSGGAWNSASNWMPAAVPNNTGADTYSATIGLVSSTYSVGISTDATIDGLLLNSPTATVNHTGGTLRVTHEANLQAGTYRLNGGTLAGGVWNVGSAALILTPNVRNTLDGVDLRGSLNLLSSSSYALDLKGGTTYQGDLAISENDQITFYDYPVVDNHSFTFSTTNSGNSLTFRGTAAPTMLGANCLIRGSSGSISDYLGQGIVNAGRISADIQVPSGSQYLRVSCANFSNEGVIEAKNRGGLRLQGSNLINTASGQLTADPNCFIDVVAGSDTVFTNYGSVTLHQAALTLSSNWSNRGVIYADNSTVNLGYAFTTAQIGTIHRTGGTINITGTLDNSGDTLQLDASTGSWNLMGGYIKGGFIQCTDGAQLVPIAGLIGTLDGATLQAPLMLSTSNTAWRLRNNASFQGDARLSAGGVRLIYSGGQTIEDKTFQHASTVGTTEFLVEGPGEVTLGPTSVIRGGSGAIGPNGPATTMVSFRIRGAISADQAGSTLELRGGSINYSNEGLVEARNGGTVAILAPTTVANFSGSTISNGKWYVYNNSRIDLATHRIEINQADVLLSGPNSSFSALDSLQWNRGRFSILDGRNFSTTLDFQNDAWIHIGDHDTLAINGSISESELSTIVFDLAGLTPGSDFGQLVAEGGALLAGSLAINLTNGFVPAAGDEFRIISAAESSGSFDTLAFPILENGLTFNLRYDALGCTLAVVPEPAAGLCLLTPLALVISLWRRRRDAER